MSYHRVVHSILIALVLFAALLAPNFYGGVPAACG